MRIIVSTHQGNLYNEEVDYIVVHSSTDGEFAIMHDHVPVIAVMDSGYVKLVKDKEELYVVVVSGVLDYHDNQATVLVQEAHIGRDAAKAMQNLVEIRKERLEKNRKEGVDFTQKEKELRENLGKTNAGSL